MSRKPLPSFADALDMCDYLLDQEIYSDIDELMADLRGELEARGYK